MCVEGGGGGVVGGGGGRFEMVSRHQGFGI